MTGSVRGRDWGTGLAVAGLMLALFRAAGLSSGHDGDERERAAHASETVIRPLAARGTDATR